MLGHVGPMLGHGPRTACSSGSFGGLCGVLCFGKKTLNRNPWLLRVFFGPFWGYVGPMLGPCGTYVGLMLDHVVLVGAMLRPS